MEKREMLHEKRIKEREKKEGNWKEGREKAEDLGGSLEGSIEQTKERKKDTV